MAAPRVTTGPILLTGLAVCATCEGAMTLRTGTSKTGRVHRYYSRSTCSRKGKTVCKGRSVRMEKLDELVTTHLRVHPNPESPPTVAHQLNRGRRYRDPYSRAARMCWKRRCWQAETGPFRVRR
ncbi:zinc ribbon domain-containing protein [Bradyrhizobium liaoningense]